ncbi:MAG: methyltransferase domain-containing protein [Thermoproteus sp. AZ2]|jgi:SAM-dependent methyltransferase|uniref:Methyltransferase domain-containing protein n=1 Tax=Thermoproteus sp. AZ2 TaxID=1609232 RepID=A0ACC6UYJ6_9CREN|nr:MAG: methyltransferase type 11 [Vulcanisaeta sp. AZ3]
MRDLLSYKLRVRDYYGRLGSKYLDLYLGESVLGYVRFLEGCSPRGSVVLDVGCGVGVGAGLVSGVVRSYVCLDLSCDVLKHPASLPNVDVVCADGGALPIRHGSVDYVLLINVVNAEGDGEYILREASSLGARLFAVSPRDLDNALISRFVGH